MTMLTMFPESVEPDCAAELLTMTAMKAGSGPSGGGVLLPVRPVQVDGGIEQLGDFGLPAKPLKLAGPGPPLIELSFDHRAPQKVTAEPTALSLSPITKEPPPGAAAKINTLQVLAVVEPPSSLTVVVMLKLPVDE